MDWLIELFNKLIEFLYRLLITLIDMVKDVFFWAFEQVFDAINVMLSWVMGFLSPIDISQYLTGLPPEVAWVMTAIGVPQALTIILTCLSVRLLLQLIPFTRLGS
ncbi:DUF2523 family protein [Vibrio sp. PID23_8]|uniref:DUF2523 family protein n=1 Tax=Vibrio sp. PID23_8 TaxID=1583767 RepID=UPI000E697CE4|nr:DUF2523 family protein [Vibrio sp. PID23_8]RIZ55153.1 VSK receptor [Vibrio sp. PID23_8]